MFSIGFSQDIDVEIFETLVEEGNSQSIPYGTIALYNRDSKDIITGAITDKKVKFSITTSSSNCYS